MNESESSPAEPAREADAWFRALFENSADAMALLDPASGVFVDCNEASAHAIHAKSRLALIGRRPSEMTVASQPDGRNSSELITEVMEKVLREGSHRFEWQMQRLDGTTTWSEIVATAITLSGRQLILTTSRNIEERKRMEQELLQLNSTLEQRIIERTAELRASEERFRRVYELSRLGICVVRWDGSYVEANPAYCTMLGYDRDELGGRSLYDVTPADHREADVAAMTTLRETGFLTQYRKEYLRKDQRRITVVMNAMVVHIPSGKDEVWAFVEDITERTRAEQQLRNSEEKFKSLFELSPLGMARVSWDGRFLQVNRSFAQTIGYTEQEVLHLSYWDVTPQEYEEREKEILETVQQTGRFGPFEKEYIHRDGHRVPIVLSGALLHDIDGEKQLWGITQDITLRKKAEQALRDSEQSFRALFEASSQGVMIQDETRFIDVNAAGARLFSCSREEVIGRHPRDLAAPFQSDGEPSDQASARHIATCLREGQARFEWLSRRVDGTDVPLDVVLTSIEMGGRKVIQAMVTDISERKRVEEELRRALERERELSLLKTNFVSMVSHEFRTPLGIIQSSAEILDEYLEQLSVTERREQLTSIIRNSRRMASLMEEVLVLGRLDSDRMQFQPAPLDLAALCRRLVDEVHSISEHNVRVEFFTSALPDHVLADERLLRHVLLNLLTNAIKYSEPGQSVRFHAQATRDSVEFVIRDDGIGIPEAEQRQLFTAFQRGSNVGHRPGTGLGLVIVKHCLDLHGGALALDSQPGRGTTATVSLPNTPCHQS